MNQYLTYDSTGRILTYGQAPYDNSVDGGASMAAQAGAGESWLAIAAFPDASQSYIVAGIVTPRSACPISASTSGRVVTLTGVPSGAAYSITGDAVASGTADSSGTLALTFTAAGSYTVAVPCFPAVDYSGSFTLT